MAAQKKTKEIEERFERISELGCVAQVVFEERVYTCGQPAEVHHCKGYEFSNAGAKKADHKESIGLCYNHHRGAEGFHTIGKETWEAKYGKQIDLLEKTNEELGDWKWVSVN